MKTVGPVGTTKVHPMNTIDFLMSRLGSDGPVIEEGVFINHLLDHLFPLDPQLRLGAGIIESDDVIPWSLVKPLKAVHPVTDEQVLLSGTGFDIPCRPCSFAFGKQASVMVKSGGVFGVFEIAENISFSLSGIGKHAQSLIAMTGENDFVEGGFLTRGGFQERLAVFSANRLDRSVQVNPVCEGTGHRFDI